MKKYNTSFYSLDALIAVGYRVNSFEATHFRRLATNVLKEYIKNAYEDLIKLNKEGLIKLYLYPEKSNRIPQDNSDLISKLIK